MHTGGEKKIESKGMMIIKVRIVVSWGGVARIRKGHVEGPQHPDNVPGS